VYCQLDTSAFSSSSQKTYGLDCEMVGCGSRAEVSMLARVTLVSFSPPDPAATVTATFDPDHYTVVYDRIVAPTSKVKDYRTK